MSAARRTKEAGQDAFVLRLYVAGGAPRSREALSNLKSFRKRLAEDAWEVEVIDVLVEPRRALEDGVLVTPTLVKLAPLPSQTIIGDLSDAAAVLSALGLPGAR